MRPPNDDKDQKLVVTPYGKGLVVRSRQNGTGVKEIELIDWNESRKAHLIGGNSSNNKQKTRSNMLYSSTNFPSIKPEIGSDVITTFGRGKVVELRDDDDVIVVRLSSWRLAGRSNVTCYFSSSSVGQSVHVVRPHRIYEMSVYEKIEHAQKLKESAATSFSTKNYQDALQKYAEAVDAVRYIQHRGDSTNFVRFVYIKSSFLIYGPSKSLLQSNFLAFHLLMFFFHRLLFKQKTEKIFYWL